MALFPSPTPPLAAHLSALWPHPAAFFDSNSLSLMATAVAIRADQTRTIMDFEGSGPNHGQQRYQQRQQPVFTTASAETFREEWLMMRTNQQTAAAEPFKANPNITCPVSQHYAQPKTMTSNGFTLSKKRGKYKGKFKQASAVERRNARERTRVNTVNQAFVLLRRKLPSLAKNTKRVSKLKILRASIAHIDQLLRMLDHEVMPSFEFGTDLCNNEKSLMMRNWSNNGKEQQRRQVGGASSLKDAAQLLMVDNGTGGILPQFPQSIQMPKSIGIPPIPFSHQMTAFL
uniref:BHLH domain-containing protein n=1 Tax=Globodera pallida TaxID=36090 RepID=A0A183BTT3_GLOPA